MKRTLIDYHLTEPYHDIKQKGFIISSFVNQMPATVERQYITTLESILLYSRTLQKRSDLMITQPTHTHTQTFEVNTIIDTCKYNSIVCASFMCK